MSNLLSSSRYILEDAFAKKLFIEYYYEKTNKEKAKQIETHKVTALSPGIVSSLTPMRRKSVDLLNGTKDEHALAKEDARPVRRKSLDSSAVRKKSLGSLDESKRIRASVAAANLAVRNGEGFHGFDLEDKKQPLEDKPSKKKRRGSVG